MVDVVSPETRSRMMSGIRGKDTKPELLIRKSLFREGYRYRLYHKTMPGKPDLVLKKYRAVIFINGCFWHGHDCKLFKWPKTRMDFWKKKIEGNRLRDEKVKQELLSSGWRVMTIWECATRGTERIALSEIVQEIIKWLESSESGHEIRGMASRYGQII